MPLLSPALAAFTAAARQSDRICASQTGETITVGACRCPQGVGHDRGIDLGALLMQALAVEYSPHAAAVAGRELHLHECRDASLASATVQQALACAATAQALHEGREYALRMEYSAALLGTGFLDCCRRCGVDARRLPAERRAEIDRQVGLLFDGAHDTGHQALAESVCTLLLRPMH